MNTHPVSTTSPKRRLQSKIKKGSGKFRSVGKARTLSGTADNRSPAETPLWLVTVPSQLERVSHVVKVVEMLNALKRRRYRTVEMGDRIVLESDP